KAIETGAADILLLDVVLPERSGLSRLQQIARENPSPPVILITAFGEVDIAVQAMKQGALDFLQKPLDLDQLIGAVQRANEVVSLRRELAMLRKSGQDQFEWIIGEAPAMLRIAAEARRAAAAAASVLITGETGTGKEVLAQVIRYSGPRADKPFVPVNCAALPDTMIESELFGHEAGVLTGAPTRKRGFVEGERT